MGWNEVHTDEVRPILSALNGTLEGNDMIDHVPDEREMMTLLGARLLDVWERLCAMIEERYEMECRWNSGGKAWTYERKYRRGGKTLCSLYARDHCIGFMVIFGKAERDTFETERDKYSPQVQKVCAEAKTYHDGKWILFTVTDTSLFPDFMNLLRIKRRPDKKTVSGSLTRREREK